MRRMMNEDGPVEFALFDGYDFAERILEGVIFKVWIDENDEIQVEPMPGNEEYLSGLNMKKWLKEAKIFAEEADVFCGEDTECWIEGEATPTEEEPKLTKIKILAHRTFSHDSEEYHQILFKVQGKKRPDRVTAPTSQNVPEPERIGRRIVKKKKKSEHQLKTIKDIMKGK